MKTKLLLLTLLLSSCAIPEDSAFNPLDEPGASQPTVEELHEENVHAIIGIP